MKPVVLAILAMSVPLSACDLLETARIAEGPARAAGVYEIDCLPEPTYIYSKAGDLIDTIHPLMHPLCEGVSSSSLLVTDADLGNRSARAERRERDDNDYEDARSTGRIAAAETPAAPTPPAAAAEPTPEPDTEPTPEPEAAAPASCGAKGCD